MFHCKFLKLGHSLESHLKQVFFAAIIDEENSCHLKNSRDRAKKKKVEMECNGGIKYVVYRGFSLESAWPCFVGLACSTQTYKLGLT